MKANGVEVYATCTRCSWTLRPFPLGPVIEKLGPGYSLFDRRPRCKQPGCKNGQVLFMYRSAGTHGTPFRPCRTTL